jgi:orotate phosphoribosyltransferase
VDDVIMRGKTKRQAAEFIRLRGGIPVAIVIAFDREERDASSSLSGAQVIEHALGIPTIAAAKTTDLIDYLTMCRRYPEELSAIKSYQEKHGVSKRV